MNDCLLTDQQTDGALAARSRRRRTGDVSVTVRVTCDGTPYMWCECDMTGATYENFVEELKEAEDLRQCRYGVFDAEYKLNDGQSRQKLVFFLW